ncbi:hypothetical protein [Seohaeicola zhoushanensis]|uniref:DNA alkylation repair protein n=1 Tax=Seohaeicola zhoushanensis TaxID=1569283 RepID=A0A8J3M6F3_9RHOB|nr:hypothetical protein [Seohaeicola zhoushanensis]GHF47205.1 hypothetical protein GCM10017056_18650 [Seohaeicola zhoushanensis]
MASGYSLKDQLFNRDKVRWLAGRFAALDGAEFEAAVMARLPELELKQRIDWIARCLVERLPPELPEAAPHLLAALPPPLDPSRRDDDFGDFIIAPLGEAVVALGLEAHPELSLDLLAELTQRFSMEYAIRPFLNRWPEITLRRMAGWARHEHYHVRRLVSEGTRPRLPWGMGIGLDISAPLPLLDALHGDPARFVTRSVANHLNDIAKKAPDLAMDQLAAWRAEARQEAAELDWMTRHALRGLVKEGHPRALAMLGFAAGGDLDCRLDLGSDTLRIGDALEITCELASPTAQPVLVDYVLHFARPDGKTRRKVFKLKQSVTVPGLPLVLAKRHPLKGDATTFTLHPGRHRVELQVNGTVRAEAAFDLIP